MTHDPAGNPLTQTDPEGKVTTYAHDALDRETLRSYPPPVEPTGDDLVSIATASITGRTCRREHAKDSSSNEHHGAEAGCLETAARARGARFVVM